MMKPAVTFITLAFTFISCSSAGQVQSESDASATPTAPPEENVVAPWFDHNNKAYSDSLTFTGLGSAIAPDSAEALVLAEEQAMANLKFAIDSHAENLRRELAESDGNSSLTTSQFILSLRRTVGEMNFEDSELTFDSDYAEQENGSVIAYSKLSAQRESALEKLISVIDNQMFSGALRESVAR